MQVWFVSLRKLANAPHWLKKWHFYTVGYQHHSKQAYGKSFLQWAEYVADSELKTLSSTIQMSTLGLAMPVRDSLNNCINKETNILSQCLWVSTFDFNFLPHKKCCLHITVVKHHQNIFTWYIWRKPYSRTEQTVSDRNTNCTAFHCSATCQ